MEKVSVIVPIYNVAKYLDRCVASIVEQDYANLEIILVNDGSTDDSLQICAQYAAKDHRIKIINHPNQGRGAARNHGLDAATAPLVTFVDGDDFILPNYVTTLVKQKQHYQTGIAQTTYMIYRAKLDNYYESRELKHDDTSLDGVYSPAKWLQTPPFFANGMTSQTGARLYDRQLFKNIRFPENHLPFEDGYTSWQVTLLSNKISFENRPTYVITYDRPDSITNTDHYGAIYHSVKAKEEKLTVMQAAGLHPSTLINDYLTDLEKLKTMALKNGDYSTWQRTTSKLAIIEKYKK